MLLIFANNRNHVEEKIFLWIHVEFFDFYSGIETKDETEKENKDFRRAPSETGLVRPGQWAATWEAGLLPDNKREASETFQILTAPQAAALECPKRATAEIGGPGDGVTHIIS